VIIHFDRKDGNTNFEPNELKQLMLLSICFTRDILSSKQGLKVLVLQRATQRDGAVYQGIGMGSINGLSRINMGADTKVVTII